VIAINYNNKIYELNVLETKPAEAVSIIECDMNVEFEAPPGYVVSSKRFFYIPLLRCTFNGICCLTEIVTEIVTGTGLCCCRTFKKKIKNPYRYTF
jgi:hypothetical protein